jgi:hypothetical protein
MFLRFVYSVFVASHAGSENQVAIVLVTQIGSQGSLDNQSGHAANFKG